MKRDRKGRFTKSSRWEKIIGISIVVGIVLPLVADAWYQEAKKPALYEAEPEEEVHFTCPYDQCIGVDIEWTEERIIQEIRSVFFETPDLAVRIARCESRLKPNAVGPTNDYGLMQIHAPSWNHVAQELGLDNYKTDVLENLALARHIYELGGWNQWVCYTRNLH